MEDHNARIIVFGRDGGQAQAVAEATAREEFHNVSYFSGTFDTLKAAIKYRPLRACRTAGRVLFPACRPDGPHTNWPAWPAPWPGPYASD